MNSTLKENVNVFNADVLENSGYKYATGAKLSSILANKRILDATINFIDKDVSSLIDVGCGDGTYTNEIGKVKPDIALNGFDPAGEAVEMASKKFPGIQFFKGDILDTATLPDKKFDIGIIRGVLHHLKDPKLGLKNAGILADKIIIIEPNGNNPILKLIEKISPYHKEHEEQSFSSKKLVEWCKECEYTIWALDYIGFVPFFFPSLPTRIIYFFQPFLEKIFLVKKYFGAQIVIVCSKS